MILEYFEFGEKRHGVFIGSGGRQVVEPAGSHIEVNCTGKFGIDLDSCFSIGIAAVYFVVGQLVDGNGAERFLIGATNGTFGAIV